MKELKRSLLCYVLAFSVIFSLCGCRNKTAEYAETTTISETTVSEAATQTTSETTAKYSEEELEKLAQDMPEIIFVMSHQQGDGNIMGCYVMNTGEMKLFDYRSIAPDEVYDVKDIYEHIEEAHCDRLEPLNYIGYEERLITEEQLPKLSQEEVIGYYKRLLQIEGDAEYIKWGWTLDYGGLKKLYGIKKNERGEKECILLSGCGIDSEYDHINPDARQIHREFSLIMPNFDANAAP